MSRLPPSTTTPKSSGEWEANPFATRFVRPGSVPFLFAHQETVEQLVDRLGKARWYGQIVGPHGSGKSTLLASMLPGLRAERPVALYALSDQSRGWGEPVAAHEDAWKPGGLVVIDGFEQLGPSRRWWTHLNCRRRRVGLLVSCHRPTALPVMWRTTPSLPVFRQMVDRLIENRNARITDEDVATAFAQHRPSVREALFALYDLHELRRRSE